ncbi:LacI family transcriptional regulator [Streptomyces sp. AJS327]|uniref:LacI family DNA-binding transcriptional regulator n=1 Tax=Streptomyces sp. AJS327 TaxID=2545265 RepID=UPI0015DD5A28|nr:LacI family DNA-binding transcriptional regulator [Streptomyces sp. AJS327]MBA0052578.1 LacI family transcriptional regulator [Streptomyces sp. AJS327]
MATISDVARAAGVSPATVSRVFNSGRVTPERAERVRRAAAELGFSPNRVARSLRIQRASVIGLLIPDIENPFFTALARGVEDAAQRTNHSLVLCNSDEDVRKESRYLEIALAEQMAGVIVAAASRRRTDLSALAARGMPVVAVDRRPRSAEVDTVLVDNQHGSAEAVAHLLDRGYRRIACVTGPAGASTSEDRLAGYRAELLDAGVAEEWIRAHTRHADFREEGGYAAMRELLALPVPPDAVFVANNLMTVGALRALREAGVEPPEFGILSFGDVPWASLVRPPLTTVHLPAYELGVAAAELLQERIAGSGEPLRTVVLRTALRPRSSTAGPDPDDWPAESPAARRDGQDDAPVTVRRGEDE